MRARARLLAVALGFAAVLASPPADARCGRSGVTVYSAYWCPYCKATERFLAAHGVRYRRIEVANDPAVQRAMTRRFGSAAVPVVVVNGGHWSGHDEGRLRRALCLR